MSPTAELQLEIEINASLCSCESLPNLFNDYFIHVGSPMSAPGNQPERSPLSYIKAIVHDRVFIAPTYQDNVISVLCSFHNNAAAGKDDIKALHNKEDAGNIEMPLTYVYKKMLAIGIIPKRSKIPRVTFNPKM